jgi:hypothetical protein
MARRLKGVPLENVPKNERTAWGYPNDNWVFHGYDEKIQSSRWITIEQYEKYNS